MPLYCMDVFTFCNSDWTKRKSELLSFIDEELADHLEENLIGECPTSGGRGFGCQAEPIASPLNAALKRYLKVFDGAPHGDDSVSEYKLCKALRKIRIGDWLLSRTLVRSDLEESLQVIGDVVRSGPDLRDLHVQDLKRRRDHLRCALEKVEGELAL